MTLYLKQIVFILFTIFLISCQEQTTSDSNNDSAGIYQKMDAATFQKKLSATPQPQLIDVRTPTEYKSGNIKGSINYNIKSPDFIDKIEQLDRNQPVFVYCKAGGRSSRCAAKMQEMGFTEIYELEKGFDSWK